MFKIARVGTYEAVVEVLGERFYPNPDRKVFNCRTVRVLHSPLGAAFGYFYEDELSDCDEPLDILKGML